MWSCDRRFVMLGLAALPLGCGFAPAYGPQGGAGGLQSAVALPDPGSEADFLFDRRFEERMGRAAPDAPYRLTRDLGTQDEGLGSTSAGYTTRYRLNGTARYRLLDRTSNAVLHQGSTRAFTGYSTTGSTVATRASARDAQERLMVILADQVIDALILAAADLPT